MENKLNIIYHKIRQTAKKDFFENFWSNFSIYFSISLVSILFASLVELLFNGNKSFREGLFYSSLFILFLLLLIPIVNIFLKISNVNKYNLFKYYAEKIGYHYSNIKDRILNTVQLYENKPKGTSEELVQANFDKIYSEIINLDFNVIIDKKRAKKSSFLFIISIITFISIYTIFNNSLGFALSRIINYNKSYLPPAPFNISFINKDTNLLRGDNIDIIVKSEGKSPDKITLSIFDVNNNSVEEKYNIKKDSNNYYTFKIQSIKSNLKLIASAEWLTEEILSNELKISVIDRPIIKSISGNLIFPSYTQLPPKIFDETNADFSALKGSKVNFNITSNKKLKSAKIHYVTSKNIKTNDTLLLANDTISINLSTNDNRAFGNFTISNSGYYYFIIEDIDGIINNNNIKYNCIALNDASPEIELIYPVTDVQLSEQGLCPIQVNINDDYGFSHLKLYYKLVDSKYTNPENNFSFISIPINKNNYQEIDYFWDLNKLNIAPSDIYEFYLEVADNDIVSGPKTSRTISLLLRLPSLDEVLKKTDEEQKKIENELKNVLKQTEEIKKDIDEVNKELLKNNRKELDWKEKKKLEEAVKKQETVQKRIQDLQKNLNEITEKLEEKKALSPETLQKYQELQKLMKEISSPELKKLQEKMNQLMKSVSPEQMQKLMKDFKFDEEQFKKSIERTLKLLKRLQAEQKIDALTKKADEAEKKLDELNKTLDNTNLNDNSKNKELQKQQKNIKDDISQMQNDLNELEKLMKEVGKDMPLDDLMKSEKELSPETSKQEMDDAQNSTQKGDSQNAKNKQNSVKKKMNNFKRSLSNMKQKMQQNQTKEAIRKMQKAVNDMLSISEKQEELKDKTSSMDYNSTKFPEISEQQADLNSAMMNVANSLMDLSEKSTNVTPEMAKQIGEAIKNMNNALNQMSERNPSSSSQSQMNAMSAMNSAAKQMQQMVAQMQAQSNGSCDNPGGSGQKPSPGGMGGAQQQLQQIANQQQGINQAMQQMMQQGGQMSQEMRAQMGKLANEQGKAQKALEELNNKNKNAPQSEKLPFGDLDNLNKDMKEVLSDMQNNNITPETLKRQEKILSRLLDYSRAINERDFEKNRESKTGKEFSKRTPKELDIEKLSGKENKFQDMIRSLNAQYTKDYEELIKRYFEKVQKESIE